MVKLTYGKTGKVASTRSLKVGGTLGSGDVSEALSAPDFPDKTISVGPGVFSGGVFVVRDRLTGSVLDDQVGDALSFSAAGCKWIAQNPAEMEFAVIGGDGSTSVQFEVVSEKML